jgi:peptidoglycan-associated lipoprotein
MVAAALMGCESFPTDRQAPAGAEERKAGAGSAGAETAGIERKSIASVDLTAGKPEAAGLPKSPDSLLSKRSIYYELDQFVVRDEYRSLVEAHAKHLRDNPGIKMLIQGNADERGSREYNVGLGQRRAEGVKRMLLLLGAREEQIESVSLGEEKPRAEGHDESAWSQNRRSDLLYSGEF